MCKIKICGLTREMDVESVNRWLPDFVGFIFAESRRKVTAEKARTLKSMLNPAIKSVGVFVNESIETIAGLYSEGIFEIVQLHGDEDESYLRALKSEINAPVIKAVRVQSTYDILRAECLTSDFLLLDTFAKGHYGGTGEGFNHSAIPALHKPFFIAGGLNVNNVARTAEDYRPYGLDVSSGAETDGVKDDQKIRKIIEMIRGLNPTACRGHK